MYSACTVEAHIPVNNIAILTVVQEYSMADVYRKRH